MSTHTEAETTGIHREGPREGSGKMILWSVLLFVAIGALIWWSVTRRSFSGSLTATGPTLGQWTMYPDACTARATAQPQTFTLSDSSHPGLQIAVAAEPSNPPVINVTRMDGQVVAVDFDRCGTSDVEVEVPPASGALNGRMRLDCIVADSHLTGNVSFENCK